MEDLILCPRGIYTVWWDSNSKSYKQKKLGPTALVFGWELPVTVEDMTLGTLLDLVAELRSKKLLDTLEFLTRSQIKPFLLDRKPQKDRNRIVKLEVSRNYEVSKRQELTDIVRCSGIASNGKRYALDFTPVSKLVDAVLKINKEAILYDDRLTVKAKYKTSFTLGEVLTAVFDEICFHGSPVQRDTQMTEINRRVEEIKTGKAKYISSAKVFAKFKTKSWKKKIKREDRMLEKLYKERH